MANIFDVAKYILHSVGGSVSTMRLQKLCYYAQAWNLAWEGEQHPLFNEDFEHWDNGPVCRKLFDVHQGKFSITENDISDSLRDKNHPLTSEQIDNIENVLDTYGVLNGGQLSELTHRENPWMTTEHNQIINKKEMATYYRSL